VKFVLAGNDRVDSYIPKNEVWLENSLSAFDRRALLVHELWERRLMAGGMDYDAAHERADRLEKSVRKLSTESIDEILDMLVRWNR
jgi:Mn-dependent DtxR family transcriptional regulator